MLHRVRHQIVGPMVVAWLLLTITGISIRAIVWNRLTRSLDASDHATKLEEALDQLSSSLQDAQNSQRDYLLTGNEAELAPFKATDAALGGDFDQLADAATQDKGLTDDLIELRGLSDLEMAAMRDSIKVRHDKNLKEAAALVNSAKEKATTDKIRTVMGRMRLRRQNIFSSAGENTRQNLEWLTTTGQALGYLGLGAGLLTLYLLRVSFVQERARWKLLEEKLRAEKIAVEKGNFLANMSHEIRTPMNAILGFGELLEGETLSARQAKYVRAIRKSAASLLQLINDVLDLSKMEAGKLELHLEPTDIREFCDFLQTMFGHQAAVKGLQLTLEADPMPRSLLLDRLRLRQVIVNLVSNAVKFTPKGCVSLRSHWQPDPAAQNRGTLLMEVADTGLGISPEKQGEIFKPFVQSETHRQLENEGTGLGLSIVQRLTALMDGTVTLESTPGAGSIFRLEFKNVSVSARLPVVDLLEPGDEVDFNDFAPATILVGDDNQANRELMEGLFEGTHHRLRLAANGQEVLTSIGEVKPDLVLLDMRMPVLDGRAALAEIRRQPGLGLLPVVAVTASSQPDEEADLAGQFNGHIRKPFSRQTLYKELEHFLPRAKTRRDPPRGGPASGSGHALLATAKMADTPEAAVAKLFLLQQKQWPRLRDSLAINETQAFARELRELGRSLESLTLIGYADRLARHAETYAVGDLERSLAEFPALVHSFQQPRSTS